MMLCGQRSLFQRAAAAFFAISDRRFFDSLAALALPPFKPPSRPSSTAAGFFSGGGFGISVASTSSSSAVASWTIRKAISFSSGFRGPLLDRLGILQRYRSAPGGAPPLHAVGCRMLERSMWRLTGVRRVVNLSGAKKSSHQRLQPPSGTIPTNFVRLAGHPFLAGTGPRISFFRRHQRLRAFTRPSTPATPGIWGNPSAAVKGDA